MNASSRLNMHNPCRDYGTVFAERFIGGPGGTLRAEGTEFYLNGDIWEVCSLTGQVVYKEVLSHSEDSRLKKRHRS